MAAIFSSSLFASSPLPKPLSSSYSRIHTAPQLFRARSSLLQDNEKKVIVHDSFPSKTSPLHTADKSTGGDSINTSAFEKRIIKVEQSVNIFLTDSVIKILDTLYHDRHYARFFVLETICEGSLLCLYVSSPHV
uniref:Uncharacterized protein n=1 Tax=Glycine max TaxID=3847 RepID=C6TI00_SOYBN|nr:unknown [Glycine max]